MPDRRTPHQNFWMPILSSLEKHGPATIKQLYEVAKETVELNAYDLLPLENHVEPHWKNQVRQAVNNMRREGLLRCDGRNPKEITEVGRKYFQELVRQPPWSDPIIVWQALREGTCPTTLTTPNVDRQPMTMTVTSV